jgi:hypothetical protein
VVWLATLSILVVALGVYASWAAKRLDRLHRRLDTTAGALDDQLRSRARTVARVAATGGLPNPAAEALARAAAAAVGEPGLGSAREAVENALSRELSDAARGLPESSGALADLADAVTRASFARRFYNDAVRDVLVVRRRRIVRLLHLAGHAPRPMYFEIEDAAAAIADVASAAAPYD